MITGGAILCRGVLRCYTQPVAGLLPQDVNHNVVPGIFAPHISCHAPTCVNHSDVRLEQPNLCGRNLCDRSFEDGLTCSRMLPLDLSPALPLPSVHIDEVSIRSKHRVMCLHVVTIPSVDQVREHLNRFLVRADIANASSTAGTPVIEPPLCFKRTLALYTACLTDVVRISGVDV